MGDTVIDPDGPLSTFLFVDVLPPRLSLDYESGRVSLAV